MGLLSYNSDNLCFPYSDNRGYIYSSVFDIVVNQLSLFDRFYFCYSCPINFGYKKTLLTVC